MERTRHQPESRFYLRICLKIGTKVGKDRGNRLRKDLRKLNSLRKNMNKSRLRKKGKGRWKTMKVADIMKAVGAEAALRNPTPCITRKANTNTTSTKKHLTRADPSNVGL